MGLIGPLARSIAAKEVGDRAARFVIVMTGNGIEEHNFWTPLARAERANDPSAIIELAGDLHEAPALAALADPDPALDLTGRAAALLGLSSTITGGSHTTEYKALAVSNKRQETIDSLLERTTHDAAARPFGALRFGAGAGRLQYNICLRSASQNLPIINDPETAYQQIFAPLAGGARYEERGDLIEFALADLAENKKSFGGGAAELEKLEVFERSLLDLRDSRRALQNRAGELEALRADYGFGDQWWERDGGPLLSLERQFELATAALTGDLTRTVVLANHVGHNFAQVRYPSLIDLYNQGRDPTKLSIRHDVCHKAGRGNGGNEHFQDVLDALIERQVQLIAKMARRLDEAEMLDDTVIVFISDNGSTHHSTATNWPTLILGGANLGVRTGGRVIGYPRSSHAAHRRVSNLFNTLAHAAGNEESMPRYKERLLRDHFGGEPGRLSDPGWGGPLAELWST